jgi:response regulator RpfG family c-di-GMP phosphodiesterase
MESSIRPKGSVLIVDDEATVCSVLAKTLSREGFICSTVYDAQGALVMLRQNKFDAVISDLRMPGISGLELLKRCHSEYPHTAFLVVTAVDDVHVGIEAMKLGAVDYLVKPFQAQAVGRSVERALRTQRLELEVEKYRRGLEEMVEQRTSQLKTALGKIEETYDETLEALGGALDLRDTETAGHSRRVTLYTLKVAQAMDYSGEKLKHLARGAHLHDIGKIGIPDAILRKPARLTTAETAVMQTHVEIGYELVRRIRFLAPAAELVLNHHERYDGKGYPRGVRGNDILLDARIFALADTLDAMTSDRPYRRALPLSAARQEIIKCSGLQFDPEVVHVFLRIPDLVWEGVRGFDSPIQLAEEHLPSESDAASPQEILVGLRDSL